MSNVKINFTRDQVSYLMHKTGADEPQEAVDIFGKLLKECSVDPYKVHDYLKRLMEMDKWDASRF